MEVFHEGKRYKIITSSEIISLSEDEQSSDVTGFVLDCRTVQAKDILNSLSKLSRLLHNPRVLFIWLNCTSSKFLEIRERLHRHLLVDSRANGDLATALPAFFLKVSTQDLSTTVNDALKISIDVYSFGNSLKNIHRLTCAHPGLLNGKVRLVHSLKRKRTNSTGSNDNSNDVAVKTQAYHDTRRPGKRIFKTLKKMQQGQTSDTNKRCYMCNSKGSQENLCDDCIVINEQMKTTSCDLSGRYAIVTGGRIKIGFETSLRLLRDGCFVIVTTRFTVDAAKR